MSSDGSSSSGTMMSRHRFPRWTTSNVLVLPAWLTADASGVTAMGLPSGVAGLPAGGWA